jgi:hypothetical protein
VVSSKHSVGDRVRRDDNTDGSESKRGVKDRSVAIVRVLWEWRTRERGLISGRNKIYLL